MTTPGVYKLLQAVLSFVLLMSSGAVIAAPPAATGLPPVNAIVPNFYYKDLKAARDWYVGKIGFEPVYDDGWVVIVEISHGMQLALVDGKKGLMRPVAQKGTMLSIETDALEAWHKRISGIKGVQWLKPAGDEPVGQISDHKDIQEFRVLDPGGYLIEFYRWKPGYRPRTGK